MTLFLHPRWRDLPKRLGSAAMMLAVGGVDIWLGGIYFAVLVIVLTGLMIWELARMTAPGQGALATALGAAAAAVLYLALRQPDGFGVFALLIVPLVGAVAVRDHRAFTLYSAVILLAGYTLVGLRAEGGTAVILWLIALVVTSDVLGYFAGKAIGGAKFWPAISPNKTWAGTIAGWIGAALVGAGFVAAGLAHWSLVLLSPLVALAGQMGDIAESWVKRRAGVKDSSSLIPGHGGVLDRFDALVGGSVLVFALSLFLILPLPAILPVTLPVDHPVTLPGPELNGTGGGAEGADAAAGTAGG